MFFARYSLGLKLLIVVTIPMVALLGLVAQNVLADLETRQAAEAELDEIERQEALSELADSLSEERAVYYDPSADDADLAEARTELDEQVELLLDPSLGLDVDTTRAVQAVVAEVQDLRASIGTNQRSVYEAVLAGESTGAVSAVRAFQPLPPTVLDLLGGREVADRDALEDLNTLLLLEQAAEALAVEGIQLQRADSSEALTEELVEDAEAAVTSSDEALRVTIALGSDRVSSDLAAFLAGDEWAGYQAWRDVVVLADEDGGDAVPSATPPGTLAASRQGVVDQLEDTENVILAAMIDRARSRSQAAVNSLLRTVAISAGLVAVVTVLVFALYRTIRRSLREVQLRAEEIATTELPQIIELMRHEGDLAELPVIDPIEVTGSDEIGRLTRSFNRLHVTAVELAAEQARSRAVVANMFINLGRRNQKLLMRILSALVDLERDERDPDRLEKIYQVDHLATRMRRNAESLLILADAGGSRRFDHPVPTSEIARSAVSEVEDFRRVKINIVEDALIGGEYVADLTHLIAELVENGLKFSPPTEEVEIVARYTRVGYILAVVDSGLGLTPQEIEAANERILNAASASETPSKYLGLFVVGRLAARHGMTVELFEGVPAGLIVRVRLPKRMLASELPEGVLDAPPALPAREVPAGQVPAGDETGHGSRSADIGEPMVAHRNGATTRQPALAASPGPSRNNAATRTTERPGAPIPAPGESGGSVERQGLQPPASGPPSDMPSHMPSPSAPESPPSAPTSHGPGSVSERESTAAPAASAPKRDESPFGSIRRVAGANLPDGVDMGSGTVERKDTAFNPSPTDVAASLASFQRAITTAGEPDKHLPDDEDRQ